MKLDSRTTEELLVSFTSICEQQLPYLENDEVGPYNRLTRKVTEINKELRKRGKEARLQLARLFDHPNVHVRMQAARLILGLIPEPALDVLKKIAKEDYGACKLHAGMTVALFEDGTIKPD